MKRSTKENASIIVSCLIVIDAFTANSRLLLLIIILLFSYYSCCYLMPLSLLLLLLFVCTTYSRSFHFYLERKQFTDWYSIVLHFPTVSSSRRVLYAEGHPMFKFLKKQITFYSSYIYLYRQIQSTLRITMADYDHLPCTSSKTDEG